MNEKTPGTVRRGPPPPKKKKLAAPAPSLTSSSSPLNIEEKTQAQQTPPSNVPVPRPARGVLASGASLRQSQTAILTPAELGIVEQLEVFPISCGMPLVPYV